MLFHVGLLFRRERDTTVDADVGDSVDILSNLRLELEQI